MANEEKDLIKKRASFKGRLTAFNNYINSLNKSSLSPTEANELQLRTGKLESLYDQYDEVQLKLECIVDDLAVQMTERSDFESNYYRVLSEAQDILASYNKKENTNWGSGSENGSRFSNNKLVKLPTIPLPKFSGSYDNWLEFRDTFHSLIHNNNEIDSINKFHYLRASLEGSAAVVIGSVEFSARNYDGVWKLLCERYDNKRLLLQNHVSALFNLEPVTKESSYALKSMIDQINKNLRALESLGEPVKHWDTLLIHIVNQKLDGKSHREWEEVKGRLDKDKPITFDTFITFIRNRADLLETLELSHGTTRHTHSVIKTSHKHKSMMSIQDTSNNINNMRKGCPKCNEDHNLNSCSQFLALNNDDRLQLLPQFKICFNCFRSGHYANHCKKPGCKICKRKHNTLIHVVDRKTKPVQSNILSSGSGIAAPTSAPVSHNSDSESRVPVALSASVDAPAQSHRDVLLSTALIKIYDKHNRMHVARAVLDSGSTSCLMTEQLFNLLDLPAIYINKSIIGINNATTRVGKMCRVAIKSLNESFSINIQCFILPSITNNTPSRRVDLKHIDIPSNICLADPNFHTPAAVDLIIGADIFWDLLGSQKISLGDGRPMLYETRLGWLVSGPINSGYASHSTIKCNFTTVSSHFTDVSNDDIQNQLMRFWQLDEVSPKACHYSSEEQLCEDHFVKNTMRLPDGRFCVRLPLKHDVNVLGDSKQRAQHCFLSLERRLKNKPKSYQDMYIEFMSEYERLGHMTELKVNDAEVAYYIPHHSILRESSSTTKLRVVFNAGSITTSGISLNNLLLVGPTVQDDLLSILLRFRQHKYVLVADVEKMYRQIAVHPEDRHLQRILWRSDPSQPLKIYELNTVTYGTSCAPYLATRCLKQLGLECSDERIRDIIIHDIYIDDVITGADSLDDLQWIRQQLIDTLKSGCMDLRKWKSNAPSALEFTQASYDLNVGTSEPSKTLGLGWLPEYDELYFPFNTSVQKGSTKRDILSTIAQIFDPLGLLAPCVTLLKILLQKLWLQKVSWDEPLPFDISDSWNELVSHLCHLNNLRIPRHAFCDNFKIFEIHIFTDASERAYGACAYVRSIDSSGQVVVRLLMAKSRVCPIKPTTVPRLELCGALVGARIFEKVSTSLRVNITSATFWTDSTIVLGWLKMHPSRLQPFVRNRVAEILETTGRFSWRHVPTTENPADHISRGVKFDSIQYLSQWWSGPSFLSQDKSNWPFNPRNVEQTLPETRSEVALFSKDHKMNENAALIDFNRFSRFLKLKRSIAYVLRFINKCKKLTFSHNYLTDDELKTALNLIIRTSQRESFPEYDLLFKNQKLPKKSQLLKFNVYLDADNIMRVGGRLDNSSFSYEKRHPVILHSSHQFTKLLFKFEHDRLMHAGPQLLLATIRDTYWPIGGRNLARSCYRQCLRCCRMKGQTVSPLMGNLPKPRVTPGGFPFKDVGVDYAGPINSVSRQGRGCKIVKVYIAIFICFTTKAIHLELVGDLTSNSYLLALRRFIARRGKPNHIYSDNGTSFVGAYNELSKFLKNNCSSLAEKAANEDVKFHFIPAYAPHFGGLWEAGVKSVKYHLHRVMGNCNLTYEELNTTLVEIEGILNSRPLTPLSPDPEDFLPLTPGHFLIGRPITSLPEQDCRDRAYTALSRFHRIQQLRQHFWARWSKEYIVELQHRTKWTSEKTALKLNSLVLVKEDNLPPLKWKLGRIVAVHPGPDGVNRVADIKTATGVIRRAFSKICPLPDAET